MGEKIQWRGKRKSFTRYSSFKVLKNEFASLKKTRSLSRQKGKKSMIKQSCKVTLGQGKSFGGTCQEKVSLISAYE